MRPFAAVVLAAALAAPTLAAAQPAWPSSFTTRPDDRTAEGLMWLAAMCAARAGPLLNREFDTSRDVCTPLPLTEPDRRRLVDLGVTAGPMFWCDGPPADWRAPSPWVQSMMATAAVDIDGKAWPEDVKDYAARLTGRSSGFTATALKTQLGVCKPEQRAQALKDLEKWLKLGTDRRNPIFLRPGFR